MLDVHVIPVSWQSHESALRQVRQAVFVEEQKIPPETEFDAHDNQAEHVLALNSAGQAVGCGRLLESGLIGRVAVITEARGNGLGRDLIDALIAAAETRKLNKVFLHAQDSAQGFYKKLDFILTGETFTEAGIRHLSMERALPIPFDTQGLTSSSIVQTANRGVALDTTDSQQSAPPPASDLQEFDDEPGAVEQLHKVLRCAKRILRIYSPTLDHALFDQPEVVELVSQFARRAPGAQVDILLRDSQLIVSRGHTLVELGRRLDEKLRIRRLPETIKGDKQSWLVVDGQALWVQSEPEDYRGWSDTFNPVQGERFSKRYTQFWDRSGPDPELRLLRI